MLRHLLASLLCLTPLAAIAAPQFAGLKELHPAPGAAVFHWDRASGSGDITYRIYGKERNGWNLSQPVAEVQGTSDWAVVGLEGGRPYEFLVRAADASGEEQNTRSMSVTPLAQAPAQEWRGAWLTRFDWARGGQSAIKERLATASRALAAGNWNAVIFQVRGQGDTLYPSADEPWSPLLKGDARDFDPVAYMLEQAHASGIEVHAWMNLSTIWQSGAKELPTDPKHPFFRFADARNPKARAGLTHDEQGNPLQWGKDGYVWLTSGNPEVNAYIRKQVADFLKKYDVDGMHWDDRTGLPNGTSRDPVSVARFQGRGNPMKVGDLGAWQRDQLSRLLSDLYVTINALRPGTVVSVSPFGIADKNRVPGYGRFSTADAFGVEPEKWLRMGVVDALIPQIYWDNVDKAPNYGTLVRDWAKHNLENGHFWPGSALGKYGKGPQPLLPDQQRYLAIARAYGATGFTVYTYSQATPKQWAEDGRQLFPTKARVPVMERNQQAGQIMGYVGTAERRPLVDAWIRIKGQEYIYLSSGDGFFGIPHLKPGTYTVQFAGPDGTVVEHQARVAAGKTTPMTVVVE